MLIILFYALLIAHASAQYFNTGNLEPPTCLVTVRKKCGFQFNGFRFQGNKLFAHGNFIRNLRDEEFSEVNKYKLAIAEFQKVPQNSNNKLSFCLENERGLLSIKYDVKQ